MNTKFDIVEFLKTNTFATWAAVLTILPQTLHSYKALISVEGINAGWLEFATCFILAVALDVAVLVFTLRNRKDIVLGSMVVMILINTYVFWEIHHAFNLQFIAGTFFGMMNPAIMYFYSDTIVGKRTSRAR